MIGGVLGMHSIIELHRWELRTGQQPQHARCSRLALLGSKALGTCSDGDDAGYRADSASWLFGPSGVNVTHTNTMAASGRHWIAAEASATSAPLVQPHQLGAAIFMSDSANMRAG